MTPEEMKAKLRAKAKPSTCCSDGDEDLHPDVKFITLPHEDDDASEEEEEADDLWQALMLLSETQRELDKLLEKDRRKDFLTMQEYHGLATLKEEIEDLTEQYVLEGEDEDDVNDSDPSIIVAGR